MSPPRARIALVPDVNVLFSGFAGGPASPPRRVLELGVTGIVDLIVSPALLREARDVFMRPSLERWVRGRGEMWLDVLRAVAIVVDDPAPGPWLTTDPDDTYLVTLAVSANAVLITGTSVSRGSRPRHRSRSLHRAGFCARSTCEDGP